MNGIHQTDLLSNSRLNSRPIKNRVKLGKVNRPSLWQPDGQMELNARLYYNYGSHGAQEEPPNGMRSDSSFKRCDTQSRVEWLYYYYNIPLTNSCKLKTSPDQTWCCTGSCLLFCCAWVAYWR